METFYEPKSLWQAMSDYAILKQKSLMYFKAVGIQTSTNQERIKEVKEHYKQVCPGEIFDCLIYQEQNILFFENETAASEKAQEWFPFLDEME
jgi:hypothetical protein